MTMQENVENLCFHNEGKNVNIRMCSMLVRVYRWRGNIGGYSGIYVFIYSFSFFYFLTVFLVVWLYRTEYCGKWQQLIHWRSQEIYSPTTRLGQGAAEEPLENDVEKWSCLYHFFAIFQVLCLQIQSSSYTFLFHYGKWWKVTQQFFQNI